MICRETFESRVNLQKQKSGTHADLLEVRPPPLSKSLKQRLFRFGGEGRNRAVHVRFYEENIRIFANECKHFCTTLDLSERTH